MTLVDRSRKAITHRSRRSRGQHRNGPISGLAQLLGVIAVIGRVIAPLAMHMNAQTDHRAITERSQSDHARTDSDSRPQGVSSPDYRGDIYIPPVSGWAPTERDRSNQQSRVIDHAPITHTTDHALPTWLNTLRQRGITITRQPWGITLHGPATDHDHQTAAQHAHALTIAAAGTHPDWWNTVLGRTPPRPDLQLPTIEDPNDQLDGTSWPCSTCGTPAEHLDPQLLGWCNRHAP